MQEGPSDFRPIEPNPYIVGNPIRDRAMFFGREDDLRFLHDRLDTAGRETIVLCGGRRSGKTSILLQALDGRLGERFLPVLVDMQQLAELRRDGDLWHAVARRIADRIADAVGSAEGLDPPPPDSPEPHAAFRRFLEDAAGRIGARKLVILVDEYELIEEHVHAGVLTTDVTLLMASILDSTLPVSFIFTGSRRIQERDPVVWSRLMGKALHRRISFLSLSDAERLVREPVRGRLAYENGAVRAILRLTAGHPFYTQVICQAIVDRMNERRSAVCVAEDVDAVAESISDNPLPQMVYWWKSMSLLERVLAALVAGIADGPDGFVAADAVEADLGAKRREYGFDVRRASARGALERMVEREDIEPGERRDTYRFRMDLLRRWIRVEHPVWEVIRDVGDPGTDPGGVQPLHGERRRRRLLLAVAVAVVAASAAAAVALSRGAGGRAPAPIPAAHPPVAANWAVADPSADAAVNVESAAAGGPADPAHGPPGPPEVVEPETRRFARYFRMRNQIPEPLGELPEDDLRGRSHWFVFAYRGGRLVRFEHRNGADRPQPPRWDDDEWWGKATTLAPEYRADGRIARTAVQRCAGDAADRCVTLAVFLYSADLRKKSVVLPGSELPTWNESGISVFEYDLDGTGRPTAVRFRNAMGKPQPDRQGRIAVAMTYDEAGWVAEEREEIAGATDERPGGDKGGGRRVRVRRYKRDERRNPVEIAMFDKEGRPIRFTADTDWAGVHRVTTEWDERQRPVLYRFHGPSGDPARHEGGFVMRVAYDERGNAVRKEWLDLAGRPAPANKGAVVEEYEYDGRGLPLLRRLLGRGGLPVEPTIRMRWDESGNLAAHDFVDETLRGDDGRPIVVRSRVTEYDATGRRVALRVLDGSGRPVAPEGWAVVRYEYDERGSEVLERYEGLDGRPAAPARGDFRGVSSVISEHDEWGFLVARRHRGAGGEAVDDAAGVSDIEWKRDQAGRVLSERAVSASGTPAPNHDWPGSLRREYRYDADGNVIEERAFGPDGKAVAAPTGEHIVRRAYDHLGRVVEDMMLDADGSPVMGGPYRVARMTKTYAPLGPGGACWTDPTGAVRCAEPSAGSGPARGTVIETRFFDRAGRPASSAIHGRGIARVVSVVDPEDRVTEIRYFDAADRPIANRLGVHSIRTLYADAGPIEETSLGADGLPVIPGAPAGAGFARRTWAYDEMGHEVEYRTFGPDGAPRPDEHGVAARVRRYDGDRVVEEVLLDPSGAPADDADGVARGSWEYDRGGRPVREAFFDASGVPVAPRGWVAETRARYDSLGRPVRFDLSPPLAPAGGLRLAAVAIRHEGANAVAVPLGDGGEPMVVDGVSAMRYPRAEWGEPTGCVGPGGLPLRCAPGTELLLRFLIAPRAVMCPAGSAGAGEDRCSWL